MAFMERRRHLESYYFGTAYDEMFDAGGTPREPYAALLWAAEAAPPPIGEQESQKQQQQ